MSRTQVKSIIGLLAASALLLGTASSGITGQPSTVTLPTGWKTPSELYAMLAKLPANQLDQVLYEGAKKEGALTYAGPFEESQMAKLLQGFMEKYPGINSKGMGGQQEDISNRVIAEARAKRSSFDLISVGTFLGEYRETGALAEIHDLVGNARYPAKFRGKDFYSWNLLSMVIAYNTNLVKASEAPKGYMDLMDAKWRGKFAVDNSPDTWMFGSNKKILLKAKRDLNVISHTSSSNLWPIRVHEFVASENSEFHSECSHMGSYNYE